MLHQLTTPCLGRDMSLGTLYDCRTDQPISGNLWASEKIKQHRKTPEYANETSSFTFLTENNSVTNTVALDVVGNVKLSVCSGLVTLRGAAEYLNNFQSSINQARVILKYSCRSGSEKLIDIDQMAPDNSAMFKNRLATHVVTEVEYGADAFFIFTHEIQKTEDRHELELAFKAAITKYLPIDKGGATLRATVSKNENRETTSFSCTFHGDISIPKIMLNFEEALDVCQKLPEMILAKKRADSVLYGNPKMVHLYPLSQFDPCAATISRTIDSNITDQIERIWEQFHLRLAEVMALESSKVCRVFNAIDGKVKKFKRLLERFLDWFKHSLAELIPGIRDGKLKEDLLLEILEKVKSSPYNNEIIKKWINYKKSEFNCLENYMETFENSNIGFAFQPGDLEKFTHNSKFRNVLVLSLGTIITGEDNLVNAMEKYTSNQKNQELTFEFSWLQNQAITSYLSQQMNLFCNFAKANKNINKDLKCIATVRYSENELERPGTIFLYSSECKQGRIFQVPSPPRKLRVSKAPGFYEHWIRWSPPSTNPESVIRYKVYFRRQNRTVSRPLLMWAFRPFELAFDPVATSVLPSTFIPIEDTWNSLETKGTETELEHYSMMSTGYEYHFEVAAVTECGETENSERAVFYVE